MCEPGGLVFLVCVALTTVLVASATRKRRALAEFALLSRAAALCGSRNADARAGAGDVVVLAADGAAVDPHVLDPAAAGDEAVATGREVPHPLLGDGGDSGG